MWLIVDILCVDEQLNDFDGWMLILNELRYELVCGAMLEWNDARLPVRKRYLDR